MPVTADRIARSGRAEAVATIATAVLGVLAALVMVLGGYAFAIAIPG